MARKYYSCGEGKPPICIQLIIENGRMSNIDFFTFTNMLDWDKQGDDEAVTEPLIAFLAKCGDKVIFAFHDKMAELLFSLDTYNIAKYIIKSSNYFSADGFLYARCATLVNGKPYYNAVLKGRKKLSPDLDFEALLYVPMKAWERLHNENSDKYPHVVELSYETYSNKSGWENSPFMKKRILDNLQDNLYNVDEIDFPTVLNPDQVIEIAEEFIKSMSESYEIRKGCILYDKNSRVVNEAVWYVDIICIKNKKTWPDAYETLAISDIKGKVVYHSNDHGRPIGIF